MRSRRVHALVLVTLGSFGAAFAACGDPARDLFVRPYDSGVADARPCDACEAGDAETVDPTLGGPCLDDAQCQDGILCTFDRCDKGISRCRFSPDDAQCQDGNHCNGKEICAPRFGCQPGPAVTCQDGDACTVDRCVEATRSCEHLPRDADGDGDPTDHCVSKRDCDDDDPTVSSKRGEICGNGKDDNCDGRVDETPCGVPVGDTCAAAIAVTAPGAYVVSTVAAKKDHTASCSVTTPAASTDVVVAITIPAGGPRDVAIRASSATTEIAVALETTCGVAATDVGCQVVKKGVETRLLGRSLAPGTYFLLVSTQDEATVDLRIDFQPATTRPTNESCASPAAIPTDTVVPVSIVDAARDLATGCTKSATGDLTYAFTLAAPKDVRVFAQTVSGTGAAVVSLRGSPCATTETRCRVGNAPPLFARSLPAGTYTVAVSATSPIDANLLVKTYPPTVAPANQTCAAPPPAVVNAPLSVDLSGQEDAIQNGCLPGAPNAAYELVLAQPSDVMVIGRFPPGDQGAVAFGGTACTAADTLVCAAGATPVRISRRNVPAGTYRVVVAEEYGKTARLDVLVRPTVPPTVVSGADDCASVLTIPGAGGFFTGDTRTATPTFSAGCDVAGLPAGGAKDQILKLVLTQPRRVVLNMDGSTYSTVLDVRSGLACPGAEVPDACYAGTSGPRSFLDLSLGAGTYFLQVDGFNKDEGPWNLDVRAIP